MAWNFLAHDVAVVDPYAVAPAHTTPMLVPTKRQTYNSNGIMYHKPTRDLTVVEMKSGILRKPAPPPVHAAPLGASEAFFTGDHSTRAAPDHTRKLGNRFQDTADFMEDMRMLRQSQAKLAAISREHHRERSEHQAQEAEATRRREQQIADDNARHEGFSRTPHRGGFAAVRKGRQSYFGDTYGASQQRAMDAAAAPSLFHDKFGSSPPKPNEATGIYRQQPLITQELRYLAAKPDEYHDATFGREGGGGVPRRDKDTGAVLARIPKGVARGMHHHGPVDAPPPTVAALLTRTRSVVAPPAALTSAPQAAAGPPSYAAMAAARRAAGPDVAATTTATPTAARHGAPSAAAHAPAPAPAPTTQAPPRGILRPSKVSYSRHV